MQDIIDIDPLCHAGSWPYTVSSSVTEKGNQMYLALRYIDREPNTIWHICAEYQ